MFSTFKEVRNACGTMNFETCSVFKICLKWRAASRKIAMFVTKSDVVEDVTIINRNFVQEIQYIETMTLKRALCSPPIRAGSSTSSLPTAHYLSTTGVRTIEASAQSVPSTAHCYTVQSLAIMSGKLGQKLFICFQESGGRFGKQVAESIRSHIPPNIVIVVAAVNCPLIRSFHGRVKVMPHYSQEPFRMM